mgnify:FL=1
MWNVWRDYRSKQGLKKYAKNSWYFWKNRVKSIQAKGGKYDNIRRRKEKWRSRGIC